MFRHLRQVVLSGLITIFCLLAAELQAKDIQLDHKGLKLNARLDLAPGKTLKDGLVLMLHGTLAHHGMETIKGLQDVLLEREINTLAISLSYALSDRRGMYDCNTPHRHLYTDAVEELAAWMTWLESQGVGPVTLLGHSRGGAQAARYLTGNPSPKITKAVLLAPATWNAQKTADGFLKNHKQDLKQILSKAEALVEQGKGAQIMEKVGFLYCPGGSASAETFASYYRPDPRFDTPHLLPKIGVPTLVMVGSEDKVVPDIAPRAKALADGERIKFVLIEDADHFFLDLYAEDLADRMEVFGN